MRPHIPDLEERVIGEMLSFFGFFFWIYFIRWADSFVKISYRYKLFHDNLNRGASFEYILDTHLLDVWGIILVILLVFLWWCVVPQVERKPFANYNPISVLKSLGRYLGQVFNLAITLIKTEYREVEFLLVCMITLTVLWLLQQLNVWFFFKIFNFFFDNLILLCVLYACFLAYKIYKK